MTSQESAKKLRDQSALQDFLTRFVLDKNEVLVTRAEILNEHLYTMSELLLVLNVNQKKVDEVKKIILETNAKVTICGREYFSLLTLLESLGFLTRIAPLTYFSTC